MFALLTRWSLVCLQRANMSETSVRTAEHETQLVILRLVSVLMSRSKAGTKPSTSEVRMPRTVDSEFADSSTILKHHSCLFTSVVSGRHVAVELDAAESDDGDGDAQVWRLRVLPGNLVQPVAPLEENAAR